MASLDSPLLADLDLDVGYDTASDALNRFYVPVLSRAIRYDRSVGFFRASAIAVAAKGLSRFIQHGGIMRLLIGAEVGEAESSAFVGATEVPTLFAARLASELIPQDEIASRRLEVLAWLAAEGRLEVRIAVALDEGGVPVAPGIHVPYFHEKIGVLWDESGDGVAFQGSANESETAWRHNFESFSVYRSWDASVPYFEKWAEQFEARWNDNVPGFKVFPAPEAVRQQLVRLAPPEPPPLRDIEEPQPEAARGVLAKFLSIAPKLTHDASLAEATSGVRLFPHQRKVVARLAGTYPRSWLVADEVGLGKTISAGLALRQLMLADRIKRVLILAPANVCRQWQDELFEKFGLWVDRLDGGSVHGAHPDDARALAPGENPYLDDRVLLVSSHLARTRRHQTMIASAPAWDLVVVDEAHHARRKGANPEKRERSRLMEVLDTIGQHDQAKALWLMTATPMQMHPVELFDLLRFLGLGAPLDNFGQFLRFYRELGKTVDDRTDWQFLASAIRQADGRRGRSEFALLDRIRIDEGPIARHRISDFAESVDPSALSDELDESGRDSLRRWIRHLGPIGRLMTRHTRDTLRRYRREGLLQEPIADRDVKAEPIKFTSDEQALYDDLRGLIDTLMAAHGTRRGAGFVLTVYSRRLTSSWEAIRLTLERRLAAERLAALPMALEDDDLLDEAEDEGADGDGEASIDDRVAVPLAPQQVLVIQGYLERLDRLPDSKFNQLQRDLDQARGTGRPVIVFTQFTDTMRYLADRLIPAYRTHLATYSGKGGQWWTHEAGWVDVAKKDLVDALTGGRVSVVIATDAASEGLNLQAASALINYDLPWNPMRVEQRIGRIDRMGQTEPIVTIRNYVVPGTVEERVYTALAGRIDLFAGLVGKLQPILGAVEGAFKQIFRAPASERSAVEHTVITGLMAKLDQLDQSGLDLDEEDPLPLPEFSIPPVNLAQLERALTDTLDVFLDRPGKPVSYDPDRISRDTGRWCALATFGHPHLQRQLLEIARKEPSDVLVVRELGPCAVAFRADRTPPERVTMLDELVDLGAPVSSGDADEIARQIAASCAEEFRQTETDVRGADDERQVLQLRNRLTNVVRELLAAESILAQRTGEGTPEPRLIWMDLRKDQLTGWCNAEDALKYLGLEYATVVPRDPPDDDGRPVAELTSARRRLAPALLEIVGEIQSRLRDSGV